jgi:hypothetical protein
MTVLFPLLVEAENVVEHLHNQITDIVAVVEGFRDLLGRGRVVGAQPLVQVGLFGVGPSLDLVGEDLATLCQAVDVVDTEQA